MVLSDPVRAAAVNVRSHVHPYGPVLQSVFDGVVRGDRVADGLEGGAG